MTLNLPGRQPPNVEGQNLVVEPLERALTLGNQLRLKVAGAIPRELNLERPRFGLNCFRVLAIAGIAVAAPFRRMRRVAQMSRYLDLQRPFDQALGQLLE